MDTTAKAENYAAKSAKKRKFFTDSATPWAPQANSNLTGSNNVVGDLSGMGGADDKATDLYFRSWEPNARSVMEILYVQSWAAKKAIDIPVDDVLRLWRSFTTDDARAIALMRDVEKELKIKRRISRAMKAARLHGTGVIIMLTDDGPPEMPLNIGGVGIGGVRNLPVFDRWDLRIALEDTDLNSLTYGEPIFYELRPNTPSAMIVHASRVIRFDGITSFSMDGFDAYTAGWGIGILIPILSAILQDAIISAGAAHLSQEASIATLKLHDFAEALKAEVGRNAETSTMSASELGAHINRTKSNYRIMMLDTEDQFDRVAVSWAGLPELMDRAARRIAAAADIPSTRFWGQSPVGLNATGESDSYNYALMVGALQQDLLANPLSRLDQVLARHIGLRDPIPYEFVPLVSDPEADAEISKTRAEAVALMLDRNVIDEVQAADILSSDPLFGHATQP